MKNRKAKMKRLAEEITEARSFAIDVVSLLTSVRESVSMGVLEAFVEECEEAQDKDAERPTHSDKYDEPDGFRERVMRGWD